MRDGTVDLKSMLQAAHAGTTPSTLKRPKTEPDKVHSALFSEDATNSDDLGLYLANLMEEHGQYDAEMARERVRKKPLMAKSQPVAVIPEATNDSDSSDTDVPPLQVLSPTEAFASYLAENNLEDMIIPKGSALPLQPSPYLWLPWHIGPRCIRALWFVPPNFNISFGLCYFSE